MHCLPEHITLTAREQIGDALQPSDVWFAIKQEPRDHGEMIMMEITIMGIDVELYADQVDDPEDLRWCFLWHNQTMELWRLASCLMAEMYERLEDAQHHLREINDAMGWAAIRGGKLP